MDGTVVEAAVALVKARAWRVHDGLHGAASDICVSEGDNHCGHEGCEISICGGCHRVLAIVALAPVARNRAELLPLLDFILSNEFLA